MKKECKLIDETGQTVAAGTRDLVQRYLLHHVIDGSYRIVGPEIDMTYYRNQGVVYPKGTQDGQHVSPRSLRECREFFGQ